MSIKLPKNGGAISEPLYRNLVRMEANPLIVSEQEINRTLKAIDKDLAVKIAKSDYAFGAAHLCRDHVCGARNRPRGMR
jgi:hypothetical protein